MDAVVPVGDGSPYIFEIHIVYERREDAYLKVIISYRYQICIVDISLRQNYIKL